MNRRLESGALAHGWLRTLAPAALLLALSGCTTAAYYIQAVGGQLDLWRKSEAIAKVRATGAVPPDIRQKLGDTLAMREFASRELGLPDNGSYRKYADIGRPYVVWSVFATPALSVKLKEWCFPVAGCVGYRGYFAKADAEAFAAGLRREGDDVYVGGVPAYSTLGWFDDPVLSTFIHYPETEVARLIFHELAHQEFYVGDDTEFNESFAVTVETVGVERWLERHGDPAQRAAFDRAQVYRNDFSRLVLKYRGQLESLYASSLAPQDKLREKARILSRLKDEYERIKQADWHGFAGYDRWFGQDIDNATLASVGIYTQWVPAFLALLRENSGELPRFYAAVKELGGLPKEQRHARLARLLQKSAAPDDPSSAGPQSGAVPHPPTWARTWARCSSIAAQLARPGPGPRPIGPAEIVRQPSCLI